MAKASSGDEGIKNKFFWDLKRLFPHKPEEDEEDHLVPDFENLGLESNQNGSVSDDRRDSHSDGDDDSGNSDTQYPIRPDAIDCAFFMRTGTCRFGWNCKFNHPVSRRNLAKSSVNSSQIPCKFYLAGFCKYGERCRFNHSKSEAETSPVQYNVLGLPIRQGEEECAFYMRTGMCGYGATCRFDHPCPIFVKGSEMYSSIVTGESVNPDGTSEVTDGECAVQVPESAQVYFSLPLITNSSSRYVHQTYVRNGYQVPKCTQEMKPSFAPPAANVKMVDDHPQGPPKREPCDLNDFGLPIRPGKNVCWNYRNLGLCKLGRACPCDHPKKYSFIVPDGSTSNSPSGGKSQESEELNEQGAEISSGP